MIVFEREVFEEVMVIGWWDDGELEMGVFGNVLIGVEIVGICFVEGDGLGVGDL